jgi:hypothetical protein
MQSGLFRHDSRQARQRCGAKHGGTDLKTDRMRRHGRTKALRRARHQ